jgi:nitrite reductase (cytochrome c-552)
MKRAGTTVILSGIIVLLAAGLAGTLVYIRNQPPPVRGVTPLISIAAQEPDSALWGENFPNQYSTLQLTASNQARTQYGGSDPYSKLEQDPRLVELFAGYSFSKAYGEDRGHENSLVDVRSTGRINDKTPGTCYSCKSSSNPRLWAEMGMAAYDKTPFAELGTRIQTPIGCANCHEANSMRLIVTNPALEAALQAQGRDWHTFTRQEMRTVVCANCHVEYYFAGDGKLLTFPWTNGTRIEDIAAYYTDLGFKDWEHKTAGSPMVKMQHPEYEMYTASSTHFKAGVACADCHMAYTRDGAAKFSTHNVQSPLLNAEAACGACHTDVAYATGRVAEIQSQVRDTMDLTEDALVAAIDAIGAAAADPKADAGLLAQARDLHRLAQLRWDFVAAENSMGFHNPEEALRVLASAIDLAYQAQVSAARSVGGAAVIQAEAR